MRIIHGADVESLIRAVIYGVGNSGKTTLSTTLPEEWGNGIYVAYDTTSRRLRSVHPADRKRMAIIEPDGYIARDNTDNPDEITWLDYKGEAYDIAQRDWPRWLRTHAVEQGIFPTQEFTDEFVDGMKPGFIIWDGLTGMGDQLLAENARKNYFSEKAPTSGPTHADLDPAKKFKLPQMGDFLMVGSECLEIIEWVNEQPHHVICLAQEAIQQADAGKLRDTLLGPMTVGRTGPRTVPNRFDQCIHITRREDDDNPEGKVRVQLRQTDNCYMAGLKDALKEVPTFKYIGRDRDEIRGFWRWLVDNETIEQEENDNG